MTKQRGSVEFKALGRDMSLRFSTNALCRIEDETGMAINGVLESLQSAPELRRMRAIFRAGVEPALTVEETGNAMDELGFDKVAKLVEEAFSLAFPASEGEAGGK